MTRVSSRAWEKLEPAAAFKYSSQRAKRPGSRRYFNCPARVSFIITGEVGGVGEATLLIGGAFFQIRIDHGIGQRGVVQLQQSDAFEGFQAGDVVAKGSLD